MYTYIYIYIYKHEYHMNIYSYRHIYIYIYIYGACFSLLCASRSRMSSCRPGSNFWSSVKTWVHKNEQTNKQTN